MAGKCNSIELLKFSLICNHKVEIKIISRSMEPTILNGSYLSVQSIKKLKVGDIVVFASDNHLVIHRIVVLKKNKLIIIGDNNNNIDPMVAKEMLIAKASYKSTLSALIAKLTYLKHILNEKKNYNVLLRIISAIHYKLCVLENKKIIQSQPVYIPIGKEYHEI